MSNLTSRRPAVLAVILFLAICWASPVSADVGQAFDELKSRFGAEPAQVRLITENQEAWYVRWYLVEHARKSIDCSYFMLYNEIWGRAFCGLLLKKAHEGVNIRMLLDSKGALKMTRSFTGKDFLQELAALPNVQIRVYNPIFKAVLNVMTDIREVMASTHQKLPIVDDEWLVTGGRNIGQIYCADHQDNPRAFRDTDVVIRGGAVPAQARRAFEEEYGRQDTFRIRGDLLGNWRSKSLDLELARRIMQGHMTGMPIPAGASVVSGKVAPLLAEMAQYPHLTGYTGYAPFHGDRTYPVMLLGKQAIGGTRNDITPSLEKLIDATREEIWIQSPYVVLTEGNRKVLQRAAQRGVKITLQTNSPESTDSLPTQAMFVKEWKRLLKDIPGMRIFAFRGTNKLHAKVFVLDGKVTVVGSYNLDPLSDQVNSEDVAVVDSPEFARQSVLRIQKDLEQSVEYRIRMAPDGSIVQEYGPSDHCPPDILRTVELMGVLSIVRPLI